jgi:EmrB/QacA subfamily drug resistance transporter
MAPQAAKSLTPPPAGTAELQTDHEADHRGALNARQPTGAAISRFWLSLALVGLGASVVPLDTAVNIAFPDITASFGLPLPMIQWVVICYVLTYASLLLAFGRIGDIFGHTRVFRAGLLWDFVAFLLCAAAPSYGWLLFFRFLQGIGAGLVISVAPALVVGLFPEQRRARAVAAFTMIVALSSAAGPLIGGALVDFWGWPAVFWFRAPIALIGLLFVDPAPTAAGRVREPLDIPGALLLTLGISTLLLTLNRLQHIGFDDPLLIALVATAAASLVGFVLWERRAPRPIIDLDLFRNRGFAIVNFASVLIYLTSFSVLLFVPYYFVRLAGLPLPAAGAVLALSFVGTMAASPLAGRLIEKLPAERIALLGAVLGGAGLFAIGTWRPGGSWQAVAIVAALITQGFGVGLFQVAYIDVVMGTLPRQHRGVAGSLATLTRTLGTVSGATLLTVLFHGVEAAAGTAGQPPDISFLAAFATTFHVAGAVMALTGILAAMTVRRRR